MTLSAVGPRHSAPKGNCSLCCSRGWGTRSSMSALCVFICGQAASQIILLHKLGNYWYSFRNEKLTFRGTKGEYCAERRVTIDGCIVGCPLLFLRSIVCPPPHGKLTLGVCFRFQPISLALPLLWPKASQGIGYAQLKWVCLSVT